MKELSTNEITKSALKELDKRGLEVWRSNNIAVRGRSFIGRKGVSDIIGFERSNGINNGGRFVLCEVKGVGDKLKPDQIELLTTAKKAGCIVLIATLDQSGKFIIADYKTD